MARSSGTVFFAELWAGPNLLASIEGTGPDGSFRTFQVTFDSGESPSVGLPLRIVIGSNQAQPSFDDIRLDATPCQFDVTGVPTGGLDGFGHSGELHVVAAAGCSWTVSLPGWITLESGGAGQGNGDIGYRVLPNISGAPRTGEISVGSKKVMLSQEVPEVGLYDPNPSLVIPTPATTRTSPTAVRFFGELSRVPSLPRRSGVVADGVTPLVIAARTSARLSISLGQSGGTLQDPWAGLGPGSAVQMHQCETCAPTNPINAAVYWSAPSLPAGSSSAAAVLQIRPVDYPTDPPITVPITLVRPPVILLHGLWSDRSTWGTPFVNALKQSGYAPSLIWYAQYAQGNAVGWNPRDNAAPELAALRVYIENALAFNRDNGVAATQVDVIGHSMGGLYARSFVQQADYFSAANLWQGSIRRGVTLGTPHWGSEGAALLWSLRDTTVTHLCSSHDPFDTSGSGCEPLTVRRLFDLLRYPLDRGAVEELQPGSAVYHALGDSTRGVPFLALRSTADIGQYAPTLAPRAYIGTAFEYVLGAVAFAVLQKVPDAVFCGESDLVVGLGSQGGGASATLPVTGYSHIEETSAAPLGDLAAAALVASDASTFSYQFRSRFETCDGRLVAAAVPSRRWQRQPRPAASGSHSDKYCLPTRRAAALN